MRRKRLILILIAPPLIIKCVNTSVRCKRLSETTAKDRYSALGLSLADKVDVVVDGLGAANVLPLANVGALGGCRGGTRICELRFVEK